MQPAPVPAEGAPRILLVDDERDIILTVRTLLQGEGYEVETAHDGRVALQKLSLREFDLLILDRMMPDITGDEVMTCLTEDERRDMPIIIISAKDTVDDLLDASVGGATSYLTKPFANSDLLATIRQLLDKKNGDAAQTL